MPFSSSLAQILAATLVFGTSAAFLVLEILAGRLLAPFLGVSLETYTGIIGTVLAGISVGTWLGGRAADRHDPRRLLGPLLLVGGALALLVVPLVSFASGLQVTADPLGIVTCAAIAFFAPAAVLAAVTPTVIKLQLRHLGETGTVVGRLSAMATAGAICGTFLTGFVLVAAAPSRPILITLGAALIVVGAAVTVASLRQKGALAVAALLLLGPAIVTHQPCQWESAYFCIRIEPDPARPTGRTLYLDTFRNSYVDLADATYLGFSYAQVLGDVITAASPPPEPMRTLHIGGGGFTLPRYLAATRPGSIARVLELDPTVVAVAREQLGLVTSPELEAVVGDARLSIAREPDDAYDLVIGDAFNGLSVPWHLTTLEMIMEIQRVLRPDGTYAMNLIDYPPLVFPRAETATLRAVFANVAVVAPPERIGGQVGGGFILVASDAEIPAEAIRRLGAARFDDDIVVDDPARIAAFIGDAPVLTDDFAPVDQLLTPPPPR